jgi:predicted anti-sigma-YlaC factor YlaD
MLESREHITCQEVVELVTDHLEGVLPSDEAALFEQHLNFCEGCVWYIDQIRKTSSLVGRIREEDVPAEVRDRLVTAFRNWKSS